MQVNRHLILACAAAPPRQTGPPMTSLHADNPVTRAIRPATPECSAQPPPTPMKRPTVSVDDAPHDLAAAKPELSIAPSPVLAVVGGNPLLKRSRAGVALSTTRFGPSGRLEIAKAARGSHVEESTGPRNGARGERSDDGGGCVSRPLLEGPPILAGRCFRGLRLENWDLRRCRMERASLDEASLRDCQLDHCDATAATFSGSRWRRVTATHAEMSTTCLDRSELRECSFDGARLVKAQMFGTRVSQCVLSGAFLERARLDEAFFLECDFCGAMMVEASLAGTRMLNVTLTGADLRYARLGGEFPAVLERCDLRFADLRHADLRGVDLSTCRLRGARTGGAWLDDAHLPAVTTIPGGRA